MGIGDDADLTKGHINILRPAEMREFEVFDGKSLSVRELLDDEVIEFPDEVSGWSYPEPQDFEREDDFLSALDDA